MKVLRMQALEVIFAAILLMSIFTLSATGKADVKNFPEISIYPGADSPEKNPEDPKKDYSGITEEGHYFIWYVFNKQLQKDWDEDAESVTKKIVNFYKEELKKRGWRYIGEGVGRHHWGKGKEAIAICIPCDYEIEYMRMSIEDANANVATLTSKQFIEAFVKCIKEIQQLYEKNGMKTPEDYLRKIDEIMSKRGSEEREKFEKDLDRQVKETIGKTLKPYGVSVKRFQELKSGYQDLISQYLSEHEDEVKKNILGFSAMGAFE